MNVQLKPEYHQYIGAALSQGKAETVIISELVNKFGLSIPGSKYLINLVTGLNTQAGDAHDFLVG